ncbi:RNA-directed DNA polymerase, eukaryota [Tanacetum coccineum]|uniref:RNA-directed DNA polymerase, eukaryota n=1 Tax=Tanacetum coccineum TaxID=301880 RepID=A0ABQ5DNC5_9ASTR
MDSILEKLGFGSKWHFWIHGCLCKARSSVLVNGSPTSEFEIFKGLRQGDPLSLFLSTFAMEGLHAITSKAEDMGLIKGATFGRDSMNVSHLMYADDVIFLGEWSWLNAQFFLSLRIGNGEFTRFWKDIWCGDKSLSLQFTCIFLLDSDRDCLVANRIPLNDWASVLRRNPRGGAELIQFEALQAVIRDVVLSNKCDSWIWSLDVSGGFSFASTRHFVDDQTLEIGLDATRWNKCIPIKVNVFIWRLALNKLPSRLNMK